MFRCYTRRRSYTGRPPIYPKKPTREELEERYSIWREKNGHMSEFSSDEMQMYYNEGWCIDRIIMWRLHGEYDRWLDRNKGIRGFSEAEFNMFMDEGKSIEEVLSLRHPSERVPPPKQQQDIQFSQPPEFYYHVSSVSDDELEYSDTSTNEEYEVDEEEEG